MLTSRPWIMSLALFAANVSFAADSSATAAKPTESTAKSPLDGLKYRLVGPFRGGRATGVAGGGGGPDTYYFGAPAGGVGESGGWRHQLEALVGRFPRGRRRCRRGRGGAI